MTTTYFYFYVAEENLHAVMAQRDLGNGTFSVRPVAAYFQEKSARAYVNTVNERIAARDHSYLRSNPPIKYRQVPEWWTDRCPNWSHMERVV